MKTIIAGSRNITDMERLKETIELCGWKITEVVSGGARGVDSLGEQWAKENGLPLTIFEAEWSKYGKAAGPVRNMKMARYADALICLWDGISRGSRNMIHAAIEQELKIHTHIIKDGDSG